MEKHHAYNLYNRFPQFKRILEEKGFEIRPGGRALTLKDQEYSFGEIVSGGRYLILYNGYKKEAEENKEFRKGLSKLIEIAENFHTRQ